MVTIRETTNYEPLMELFIRNELEFSKEEPVPTDLIKCFGAFTQEGALIGGVAVALRQREYIIDGIAVEPEYRREKVASRLLLEAIEHVKGLQAKRLFLVARAPGFFKTHGFITITKEEAPNFFECLTCPQYGKKCFPEVMLLKL